MFCTWRSQAELTKNNVSVWERTPTFENLTTQRHQDLPRTFAGDERYAFPVRKFKRMQQRSHRCQPSSYGTAGVVEPHQDFRGPSHGPVLHGVFFSCLCREHLQRPLIGYKWRYAQVSCYSLYTGKYDELMVNAVMVQWHSLAISGLLNLRLVQAGHRI